MKSILAIFLGLFSAVTFAQSNYVRGMNLTQLGDFIYDAAPAGRAKTAAQVAVDQIKALGANHIILNPQGRMNDPRGNDIIPDTPISQRNDERNRYKRLIDYIHKQGMTVGIRPIFFVVGPAGEFPYIETMEDGTSKTWWHGNIQPSDPDRWFESFKQFHDQYFLIARLNKIEEYTIGAELYSMTVGLEDQWLEQPYGFPGRWLSILRYARTKLPKNTRVMYDINFTDDRVSANGELTAMGGEFERWRYRLVDLAYPQDSAEYEIWQDLVTFWNELDAIGIDMYRSLGSKNETYARNYVSLVDQLQLRSDEYASQVDIALAEIQSITDKLQPMIFKEVGFRSIEKGFIDPFSYETGTGHYNEDHQAAAYEAIFKSFWEPRFEWFQGASFWDVSVNPARNTGRGDTGFSPIGKKKTVDVLKMIYNFR